MLYDLHIIKFPAGTYGFVGSVPAVLGTETPATKSDVMGGRAFRNNAGNLVALKFPSFPTESAARSHAASHGITV